MEVIQVDVSSDEYPLICFTQMAEEYVDFKMTPNKVHNSKRISIQDRFMWEDI